MKTLITALAISNTIIIGGCNKTKTLNNVTESVQHETQQELDVNVEVEDGEMVVMINGEKRSIDLSEILGNINLEDMDGEAMVFVMTSDDDGKPMHWKHFGDADMDVDVHMIINGEEVNDLPDGIMEYVGDMIDIGKDGKVKVAFGWSGDEPEHGKMMRMMGGDGPEGRGEMREHMMRMMGGDGPEGRGEMREHMMRMMGGDGPEGRGEMRGHMMRMMGEHGNPHGDNGGEWREWHEERNIPEEQQFIEELDMLGEISNYMKQSSMAMLGIHMIRDQLEPEERLEALERIIEDAPEGSTSRNAAIIVAIETLQELDRRDEASELMVELVLTN